MKKENDKSQSHDIYFKLTKSKINKLLNGTHSLSLPRGATVSNLNIYKGIIVSCESLEIENMVIEAIESEGLSWEKI
jgi:hypothetical protein